MSQAYTLPVKPGGRPTGPTRPPLSKPELSRLVLSGTAAVIFLVLLLWLIVARLIKAPARSYPILAATLSAPADPSRDIVFFAEDLRPFNPGQGRGAPAGFRPSEFKRAATALLEGANRRAVIFYLSGVGAVAPGDSPRARPLLVTDGGPTASKETMVRLDEVLEPIRENRSVPKLLIVDFGQVGSDRDLGVFGGGFLDQLKKLVEEGSNNLIVLTSCAPGQTNWTSERGRCSVFGHYVARGLAGEAKRGLGGNTSVSDLHRYVASNVRQWAERNRGAVQTPLLLGDVKSDFSLTPMRGQVGSDRWEDEPKLREALAGAWKERDRLAASRPYRHAPVPWRLYQEGLLRAERLFRAGHWADSEEALKAAAEHRQEVARLSAGPAGVQPRSLAMLASGRAVGSSGASSQVNAYKEAIRKVIQSEGEPAGSAEGAGPAKANGGAPAAPTGGVAPKAKGEGEPAKAKDSPGVEKKAEAPARKDGDEAKPEAPGAAPDGPAVAVLTADVDHSLPTFIEGQLPVWYAAFEKAGGESDSLRSERRELLLRAVEVRYHAEEAASRDPRTIRWTRDLIEEGDKLRREAQDVLFAGESAAFQDCPHKLDEADERYRQANEIARACGPALDLVQRLRDELPYYGEWQARRGGAPDADFDELLKQGAGLAAMIEDGPAKGEAPLSWARKLEQKTREIDGRFLQPLVRNFLRGARRAGAEGSEAPWRELDALLRVPSIPAADRLALLQRVGSVELSPPLEDQSDETDEEASDRTDDPEALARALALADLETGLLRLGGLPADRLEEALSRAKAARDEPARAREALDAFSAAVRALRAEARARETIDPRGSDGAKTREALAAADGAARVLPPADLDALKRSGDPTERLDAFDLHAMLVWYARRLNEDFATRHAELLLSDAQQLMDSKELEQAADDIRKRKAARLTIGKGSDQDVVGRNGRITVRVGGEGPLPEGRAAIVLPHVALAHSPDDAPRPNFGTLQAVPPPGKVERTLLVERGSERILNPVIFYRGRVFAADDRVRVRALTDLVSIDIRQQSTRYPISKRRTIEIPDQFVLSRGRGMRRGFLHPKNSLAYKLVIRNLTSEPLNLWVKQELPGRLAVPDHIALAGKGQSEEIRGGILPSDLEFDKPKLMTIEVREDDANGRRLCAPLEVEFKKLHPREFITAEPALGSEFNETAGRRLPIFTLFVTHEGESDPVHVPADVIVRPTPAGAFLQIDSASQLVGHGERRAFRFWVLKPELETIKWTVDAEGESDVRSGDFPLNEKAKPPAEPPPPPASPNAPSSSMPPG